MVSQPHGLTLNHQRQPRLCGAAPRLVVGAAQLIARIRLDGGVEGRGEPGNLGQCFLQTLAGPPQRGSLLGDDLPFDPGCRFPVAVSQDRSRATRARASS